MTARSWRAIDVGVYALCGFLFVVTLACCTIGCAWLKSTASDTKAAIVDCTRGEAAKAVHDLGATMEVVVTQAVDPTGKVQWEPLRQLAKGMAADLGGCVLADVVSRLSKPASEAGAPRAGQLVIDRDALMAGWRALAAESFEARTFVTAGGEL